MLNEEHRKTPRILYNITEFARMLLIETQNTKRICFSEKMSLILKFLFSDICETEKRKFRVLIQDLYFST